MRLLLDPDPASGGGTPPPAPAPTPTPAPADPAAGFQAALKKHGDDAASLARQFYADNERLRSDLAEARAKAPGKDAVVLAGDDAASWRDLSALGNPAEIKAGLESGKAAISKVAEYARRELIGEASAAHGFNPKVLATLAGPDLAIEVRDGTHLGKPVRVAEVVTVEKDAKGADVEKRTPLEKYAERAWPEFLPSLRGQKAPAPAGSPPAPGGQPRPAIDPQTFRRSLVK